MGDHDDVGSFLENVDRIDALIRGIRDGDEQAFKDADALFAAQEREEAAVRADRTVINKGSSVASPLEPSSPPTMPAAGAGVADDAAGASGMAQPQDAFLRQLQVDAEERSARRRAGRKTAEELKDRGNAAFKAGKVEEALEVYTQALRESPDFLPLYTNRAQCFLKLGRPKEALEDCEWALRLDERCAKALLRRGLAYQALADYPKAIEALSAGRKVVLGQERATFDAHIEETRRLQAVSEAEKRALELAASTAQAPSARDATEVAAKDAPILKSEGSAAESSKLAQLGLTTSDPVRMVEVVVPLVSSSSIEAEELRALLNLLSEHSLTSPVSQDLFRVRGGLSLIELHASRLADSPALASALLLLNHKACKGNEANQRAIASSAASRKAIHGLLSCAHDQVVSHAFFLLSIVAETEYARTALISDKELDFIEPCMSVMECNGSNKGISAQVRTQGALLLAILAASPELHKRIRHKFAQSLFPRLRALLDLSLGANARPVSEAAHIVGILLHLSADVSLRDVMGGAEYVRQFVNDTLGLLRQHRETPSPDAAGSLEALLALLANVGLCPTAMKVLEDVSLADALVDLILVANTLSLRLRTVGLLARICNSQVLAERMTANNGLKRFLQLARQSKDEGTLENVSRALAKCARASERARDAMGTDKGLATLVDLLDCKGPGIAGNAALCIAECARSPKVCELLAATEVIGKLLEHAKAETGGLQENCSVAIARLAQGHPAHLATLRQKNGLEILYARMKK